MAVCIHVSRHFLVSNTGLVWNPYHTPSQLQSFMEHCNAPSNQPYPSVPAIQWTCNTLSRMHPSIMSDNTIVPRLIPSVQVFQDRNFIWIVLERLVKHNNTSHNHFHLSNMSTPGPGHVEYLDQKCFFVYWCFFRERIQ